MRGLYFEEEVSFKETIYFISLNYFRFDLRSIEIVFTFNFPARTLIFPLYSFCFPVNLRVV